MIWNRWASTIAVFTFLRLRVYCFYCRATNLTVCSLHLNNNSLGRPVTGTHTYTSLACYFTCSTCFRRVYQLNFCCFSSDEGTGYTRTEKPLRLWQGGNIGEILYFRAFTASYKKRTHFIRHEWRKPLFAVCWLALMSMDWRKKLQLSWDLKKHYSPFLR